MEDRTLLSEILGIILGDGSIRYDEVNYRYGINISLNGIDEYEYYLYVKKILFNYFQSEISEFWYKDLTNASGDEKGVTVSIYDKYLTQLLLEEGLKEGDKIKSGVSVPAWIKADKTYVKRCLKGLVDTDGYIGVVKTKNPKFSKIVVTFTNRSKNIVLSFKELAEFLNIRCSNIHGPYKTLDPRTNKKYLCYSVSIIAKDQVQKFLYDINPKKWKYRRELIGKILCLYNNRDKYREVRNMLKKNYGKINFFTKEQQNQLNNMFKVSNKNIEEAISNSFTYDKCHYSVEFAEKLKNQVIKFGSLREIESYYNHNPIQNLKVYRKTIIKYLETLFTKELKYKNQYGGLKGFQKWKNFNFDFLIKYHNNTVRIYRYSFFIKKKLCKYIYQISKIVDTTQEILPKLKIIIQNIDLNGKIIDKSKFHILKFGRIAYLLDNPESNSSIEAELNLLINVVVEIRDLLQKGIKMKIEELSNHFLKRLNLNWRIKNIKEILDELDLYNQLIQIEDASEISEETCVDSENKISVSGLDDQELKQSNEKKNIKLNKNQNLKAHDLNHHSFPFPQKDGPPESSKPFPHTDSRENTQEIDFNDEYR